MLNNFPTYSYSTDIHMYILASAANVQSVLSGKPVSAQHSPGQSGGAGDMTGAGR